MLGLQDLTELLEKAYELGADSANSEDAYDDFVAAERADAYERGELNGRDAGYRAGYSMGHTDGYSEGFDNGVDFAEQRGKKEC